MGFFNVVNRPSMAAGQPEDISVVLANLDAIAAVLNGGLDNTNVAPAAAIARSKIDFGAGLVNADIAAAAAIADSKVAGIVFVGAAFGAGAANTDVAWDGGSAAAEYRSINASGGSIRSIGVPTRGAGTRLVIRNGAGGAVTMLHNTAGGTGASLALIAGVNAVLASGDVMELIYDGAVWIEVDRDLAAGGAIAPTHVPGMATPNAAAVIVANQVYLIPISDVIVRTLISRIAFYIGTTSGNLDVGIYSSDDEVTFTRLFAQGSFAAPAAGAASKAITQQAIQPVAGRRWYWAIVADNAVITLLGTNPAGTNNFLAGGFFKAASFPLPASLTGMTAITTQQAPAVHGLI